MTPLQIIIRSNGEAVEEWREALPELFSEDTERGSVVGMQTDMVMNPFQQWKYMEEN